MEDHWHGIAENLKIENDNSRYQLGELQTDYKMLEERFAKERAEFPNKLR